MLNNFFDKIVCINSDKNNWTEVQNFFYSISLTVEKISSIEVDDMMLFSDKQNWKNTENNIKRCMTHLFILKYAKQLNLKNILILEDNIEFHENFVEYAQEALNQLPEDWDMLYFGGNHSIPPYKHRDNIYRVERTLNSYAIAINNKAFDRTIEELSIIGNLVEDNYARLQSKHKVFVSRPHLIWPKDSIVSLAEYNNWNELETTENRAEKYRKVILTLTTVPNRLSEDREDWGTKKTIERLLQLSYPNYEIHFNIPLYCESTGEQYIIPEWLKDNNDARLKVFRTEDYGPITKIAPTIWRIDDPEQLIISVDDDIVYQDGFIEYHLQMREKYPNAALGFAGLTNLDNPEQQFCTAVEKDVRVEFLEHYKTISYLRKFFDDEFFTDFVGVHWNDDTTVSSYLGKKGIARIVMAYDKEVNYTPRAESFPVQEHVAVEQGGCNVFREEGHTEKCIAGEEFLFKHQWSKK